MNDPSPALPSAPSPAARPHAATATATATAAGDASMHDMLRMMDVASTLRRERETAESQLDVDQAKARLRERLLATAAAAGEQVTPAEVDIAIEQYFASQHTYADPPPGWARFWAHVWVSRTGWLTALVLLALLSLLGMWLANAMSGSAPAPRPGQPAVPAAPGPAASPQPTAPAPDTRLATAWAAFERAAAAARTLAADDDAKRRVQAVVTDGDAAHTANDLARLGQAQRRLGDLAARLNEEYTVTIVDRPGERSGIDRYFEGRLSGYYLFVEARTEDGKTLPREITNAETKRTSKVSKWGEQVPEAVWNRVVADKKADGVIDAPVFAKKSRGSYAEVMTFDDGTGKPLARGRQITEW